MSAPKPASKKPTSAPSRAVDPKKVATLRETFPFLSEETATLHLAEANGNIAAATEQLLNGDRWKTTAGAKPRKAKEDKVEEHHDRRPERKQRDGDRNGDRKPAFDRKPRNDKAAPVVPEVVTAQVQQKDVASSNWVKGQSLSFADMLKKKKVEEAVPPPPPVVELPPAPAPAVEVAPTAAANETDEKPARQRRERKPRAEAVAAPVETVEAPVHVAPVAPAPKAVAVKHVLRFDRVEELLLPPHMADLALRTANLPFTFNGTPGIAQSPPPQPQPPVNSFQQSTFAMQRAWGAPDHNMAQRWNDNGSSWAPANQQQQQQQQQRFTAYQPPQRNNFNQFPSGGYQQQQQQHQPRQFNMGGGHHNHHRSHEQQASHEAYNAIREGYTHHSGATW